MRHWFAKKDGRPRSVGTLFDDAVVMLEERVMLDAMPAVTVVGAQGGTPTAAMQNVLLKAPSGTFEATLRFDNDPSTTPTADTGFGPYIELIVPKLGTDGSFATPANNDGITFNSATYLGSPVTAVVNTTFDAAGHATNTLTGDVVNGTPGQQFVVLQLPFGSYTASQTPADIVANFTLSGNADLGAPLAIQARAGFEFGNSATGNPTTANHYLSGFTTDTINPTLMMVTKTSNAPNNKEEEVGTGPNQVLTYTINVDVAEGQTLTNIDVTDLLPSSVHFLSATVTAGSGTITATPTVTAADVGVDTTGGHNQLTVHFNSVTGGSGANDAQVQVSFYVAKTTFAGASVIDPTTGATTLTSNTASATATWHPADPLDSDATFTVNSNTDTIQNQPIVIQKTATVVTDTGPAGLSPGDTVEYTLNLQVSDYFTIGNISLNDVLSDGQRLDTSFLPRLSVIERGTTLVSGNMAGVTVGASAPGDFTAGNEFAGNFVSSFSSVTGATTSTVNISNALAGHPGLLGVAGVLSGGRVGTSASGTTLQLTFRAVVQNNFDSNGLGASDRAVDQGDSINNNVVLSGSIRSNSNGATVLNPTSAIDDAAAGLAIAKGALTKSIYAINGSTTLPVVNGQTQIKAGDLITYRLQYSLPISSFENLNFTDFLPLPVLVAQGLTLNTGVATPGDGEFTSGPNDTYHLLPGANMPAQRPSESFDAAGNSVKFSYPNYSQQNVPPNGNSTTTVDLLFTLKVKDTAFADGLFLTNLATSNESNTVGNALNTNGIVQVQLAQPNLLIQKAIVSATNGTITTPQSVVGLTFGTAGTASSFTDSNGPLTDARLGLTLPKDVKAAPSIDSNVTGLDGGDVARVALVINNEGNNNAFDVTFGDTLPTGVSFAGGTIDGAASHLVVRRGDGTVLTLGSDYMITANNAGDFKIRLANNYTAANAGIGKDGATDGSDILVVTYDVVLAGGVTISPTALTSDASVNNFAAMAGGTDISLVDPKDAATIALQPPTILKTMVSSTSGSTTGNALTIGEQATYTITYTLPEGTLNGVRLSDLLPKDAASGGRYELVSATLTSIGGVSTAGAMSGGSLAGTVFKVGDTATPTDSNADGIADMATFGGVGGVTFVNTPDNAVTAGDTIVVTVVVRAVDHADNTNGVAGVNTGRLTYGATNTEIDGATPISIALPDLNIVKTLDPHGDPIDAGDTVVFTITVNHVASSIDAYDVDISDMLPTGLSNLAIVSGSGTGTLSAFNAASFSVAGGTLHLATPLATMTGSDSFTVKVSATVDNNVASGTSLTNTAGVTYTTLSGAVTGERTINETSNANVQVAAAAIDKSIETTSSGNDTSSDVLVGEQISFLLTATLAEGQTNNFAISDMLPSGLVFVSAQIVSIGGVATAGVDHGGNITVVTPPGTGALKVGDTAATPTFAFGTLADTINNNAQTTDDQILIRVIARVSNVTAFTNNQLVTNTGIASSTVGGMTIMQTKDVDLHVQVPDLTIVKGVNAGPHDAGDAISYTITVSHTAGSAGAHDVSITDVLPTDIDFSGSMITVSAGGPTVAFAGGSLVTTAAVATMSGSDSFTVTFTGVVKSSAVSGSTIGNTGQLQYSSLPGADPNERTYSGSASANFAVAQPLVSKVLSATNQSASTGSTVLIGEQTTFDITVTLAEGTTNALVISDLLPTGLTFVSGKVVSIGGNISGSSLNVNDTVASPVFNFGNVVNAFDNTVDSLDRIVVQVVAVVDKTKAPVFAGATLSDQGQVSWNNGTTQTKTTMLVPVTVAEPTVTVAKTVVTSGLYDAGDTVTYDIKVTHTAGSAAAFDVSITQDMLPSGFVVGSAVVSATSPGVTGPTVSVVAGNLTTSAVAQMTGSDSFTIRVTGTLGNAVVSGSTIPNTANIGYSSVPSADPNAKSYTDSSTANVQIITPIDITKSIATTSVGGDTSSTVFVGETVTYNVVATLAEGTTNSYVLTDLLPAGLTFQSGQVLSLGGGHITSTLLAVGAAPGVAGQTVTFNFGTVVNGADGAINGDDRITVQIVALVDKSSPAVTDAATLRNTATQSWAGASMPLPSSSIDVTVAEPAVTVAKTLVTSGPYDAGDTVTYDITVTHTAASATAFDVGITQDMLPGGFVLGSATLFGTTGGLTGPTVSVVGGNLTTSTVAQMTGSQSFTIRVTGTLSDSVVSGGTISNTASIGYSSLPGVSANERSYPGSSTVSFNTTGTQSIAKSITATSVASTDSARGDPTAPDLVPGETASFKIVVTLPEGVTSNVTVTDILQNALGRLQLVGTPVVTLGANITFGGAGTFVAGADGNGDGLPDGFSYNFGTVNVPGDNNATNNTITITYDAKLLDVVQNAAGNQSVAAAALPNAPGAPSAATIYDIVQPQMMIDKTVNATTVKIGDTVKFTTTITALDTATSAKAEDVVFTDALGGGATLTGSVVIDNVPIAVGASGVVGGVTVSVVAVGSGFSVRFGEMTTAAGANHSHTLVYNAVVGGVAGATVNNNAVVTYDSIDSGGVSTADAQSDRDRSAPDDAPFSTVGFTKAYLATASANGGSDDTDAGTGGAGDKVRLNVQDLAIGETVDVQFVISVPAGARTLSISDLLSIANADQTLAGRLTYDSLVSIVASAGVDIATSSMTPPDADHVAISFDTTALSTAGTVTIVYRAHVTDALTNQAGDKLDLPATLTYDPMPPAGVAGTAVASASLDLVAPAFVIDKTVAPFNPADPIPNAGDKVVYTVTVTNTGNGPAYQVDVSDPLPAGLTYSGTLTATVGAVTTSGLPNAPSYLIPTLLPGQTATLTYMATIDATAVTGVPIVNTASIGTSGTLPGGGGRPGPHPSDSASFTVEALQGLDKAIVTTSDANTGTGAYRPAVTDLHVGEVVTIDLTVRLTEGSTNTVVLTDKLQTSSGTLTLVGLPTITTLNGVTFTGTGAAGYTLTDTDGDGVADTITMNFGTVTLPGDNDISNNFFVVRYTAVVADRPENQAGKALDPAATLSSAVGFSTAAIATDVVAPAVTLAKSAAAGFVSRGDTVGYTITLTNAGTSPAYDLSLADVLPAGLSYVPGTTTLTVGGVTTAFASPNAVTFAMLGSGQTGVVDYQVKVDAAIGAAASYVNSATVGYDALSGPGGRAGTASGTATIATPTNVIALSKSIIGTSIPETGTAQFRPAVTDLNVGEHAVIDLTASFTEGTTGSVVITDQLPLTGRLQFVGTPTLTYLGGLTSTVPGTAAYVDTDGDGLADKVTFTFGTVTVPVDGDPTNNLIRIRYEVVVPDLASNVAGTALASPAMLTTAAGNAAASIAADIVAPNVTISKAVSAGAADAGDVKSYTVTIANTGTGPAFDLMLADALPAGLSAVAGTTVLTVGGVATGFASPASIPLASLGVGQSAVLTFDAVVGDGVVAGSTLTNGASISYDSLPGVGGHAASASATASFTTAAVQTLEKAVVATSESFTGSEQFRPGATDLTIGERATFELLTSFSEGTTTGVVITDRLATAAGVLTFAGTPTLVLGAGITISGSVTPILVDTDGDGVPDQVRFELGTVTVPGDNVATNNFVRIRYDAVLPDVAANAAGGQPVLPATLVSSTGSLTASVPVDIVAPVLTLTKDLAPDQPTDGQTTAFLLTVGHAAGSTASATNIVLTELLPAGATLAGATIVGAPAGTTISGGVITIPRLDLGQTVVVRISTGVDFAAPPTGDTVNRATIAYGTLTGTAPGGRAGNADAQAILPFGNPTTTLPGMLGLQEQMELGSIGSYLDSRYIEDFPDIDPVYSGSATPGTFITIDVSDDTGSASGLGTGIADAGGNWLVRLPSTTVGDRLERSRFDRYYDGSRLFRSPNADLFDDRSLLGFSRMGDRLSVGSKPSHATQIVRINVAGQSAGFDTSFSPAWRDQFFSMEPGLSVGGVFRDRAGNAVEGLFEGLESPEAAGLNRFNREFLTTADL